MILRPKVQSRNGGFTIVELLVVIVIIGILATITMISYNGISDKARAASLQSDLRNAATVLEIDKISNGTYPSNVDDANAGKGIKASDSNSFYYVYDAGSDVYTLTATNGTISYSITSANTSPVQITNNDGSAKSFALVWGGTNNDRANSIVQTSDGGYAIAGDTFNYGAGTYDAFIAKYTSDGTLSWNKTWGGTSYDYANSIIQTSDGGYAIVGKTSNYGAGNEDAFIAKFTSSGTLSWNKTWGGTAYEYATSLIQTSDGGYAMVGQTSSYGAGSYDAFITKYTSDGSLSWNKTWGGTAYEYATSLIQTSDGGYAMVGQTSSYGVSSMDGFVVKYTSDGTISWNKTWGGIDSDCINSIIQTSEGGYAMVGTSDGGMDSFVAKLTSDGTLSWNKTWGGSGFDFASSVVQSSDGGYVIAGQTTSYGAGNADVFITKYTDSGILSWNKTWGGSGDESPWGSTSIVKTSDGGYAISGYTLSFGSGSGDALIIKYTPNGNITGCSASMCQTPATNVSITKSTMTTPAATVTSPSATSSTPAATVTSPSANTSKIAP